MPQHKQTTIALMKVGQRGRVIDIDGGHGLTRRLEAMGVRPGQMVTKVSSMFMRGPVTIQVNNTQLALGFGMARKITIELEDQ